MRNRNTLYSFLLTVVIAGGFLAVWAANPSSEKEENNTCKESLERCRKKEVKDKTTSSWETLPQRFFSSLSY